MNKYLEINFNVDVRSDIWKFFFNTPKLRNRITHSENYAAPEMIFWVLGKIMQYY